ncbi:MAG: response regulator [Methanoregula sp.]|nr:response regulator [Methanoregula sp.]
MLRLEFEDEPDCHADTSGMVEQALVLARKNHYDAIISDWRMPVMNGTNFVSALRRQGCTAIIIIYSGKGMDPEIREALEAGANYYLNRGGDPDHEFTELKKILATAVLKQKTT